MATQSRFNLYTVARLLAGAAALMAFHDLARSLQAIALITSYGSPLSDALLSPPSSLLRLIGSATLALGMGLYAFKQRYAFWIIILGLVFYLALTLALMSAAAGSLLWADEAVRCVLFVVTIAIITAERWNSRKSDQPTH